MSSLDQEKFDALMEALADGLESAAGNAPKARVAYARVLQAAAESARRLLRD